MYGRMPAPERRRLEAASFSISKSESDSEAADLDASWARWVRKHARVLESPRYALEAKVRRGLYARKLMALGSRNTELEGAGASYRVGPSVLAALSDAELDALTGGFQPLGDDDGDRARSPRRLAAADSESHFSRPSLSRQAWWRRLSEEEGIGVLGRDLLPVSVDWRKFGAVTDVKAQGTCGACWAFAATGALEGQLFIDEGVLISLSEDQLMECDADPFQKTCFGGNFFFSLTYMAQNAMATEVMYPYSYMVAREQSSCRLGDTGIFGAVAASDSAGGARFVEASESALKEAVARQPVAVAIHAYTEDFKNYRSGVLDTPACNENVDHAALVVGYGTTLEGVDFWLVKNQWGDGWGDAGFIKIARNSGAAKGMCGILRQANVPTGASCADTLSSCSSLEGRKFCIADEGCLEPSGNFTDEEWLVPTSTFRVVESPQFIEQINDALSLLAILLTVAIALIAIFLVRHRANSLKRAGHQVNWHNFRKAAILLRQHDKNMAIVVAKPAAAVETQAQTGTPKAAKTAPNKRKGEGMDDIWNEVNAAKDLEDTNTGGANAKSTLAPSIDDSLGHSDSDDDVQVEAGGGFQDEEQGVATTKPRAKEPNKPSFLAKLFRPRLSSAERLWDDWDTALPSP